MPRTTPLPVPLPPFPRRARPSAGKAALCALLALITAGPLAGCATGDAQPPVGQQESRELEPGSFAAAWSRRIPMRRYGQPDRIFLRDDLVVLYTNRNAVFTMSAVGGSTLWVRRDIVGPRERLWPPVLLESLGRLENVERVLSFPANTSYFVVNAEDGEIIQESILEQRNRAITSPSYAYDGVVYVGLSDPHGGRAARIDPTRPYNPILLPILVRGAIIGRPVVFEDTFFVADQTGAVYAITEGGSQAWLIPRFQTGGPISATLMADADGLYVSSQDSLFHVLDRYTGRLLWSYFAEVPLHKPAFPTETHVFLPVEGRGVIALSKTEGRAINREPVWTAEDAREVLSHDQQNVYLLHTDGRIVAHRKTTGEELFATERSDFVAIARNLTGPRIHAATANGEVLAIDPVLRRGQVGRMVQGTPTPGPAVAQAGNP